ncbi:MAG: hypothetical protein J6U87_01530, partial [Clostridia bacterium]|nr:hypothetical protein [Clostridia bacterium]
KVQPAYEGQVYAPFALPVQPFPKRVQPTASAAPVQDAALACAASTPVEPFAPIAENAQEEGEDELLGVFRPEQRVSTASAPEREVPAQDPSDAFLAFAPAQEEPAPAQKPTVDWENEREAPVTERFGGDTVAPFAAFEESEPEEGKAPVIERFGGDTVAPFATFEESETEEETFEPLQEEAFEQEPEEEFEDEPEEDFTFAPAREESIESSPKAYFAPLFAKDDEPEDEPAPVVSHTERVEPHFARFDTPAAPAAPAPATAARVAVHTAPVREEPVEPEPVMREYVRPPIHLLNEDKNVRTRDFYEEIEETKDILRQTMASFNIKIQDEINYSHGPSVTRYEMRPVAGTSVRSVTNRTEDIALNLASSVRIEAPIPGKPAIGIEVPNKVRETVFMRTMLESDAFRNSTDPLDVPLGLDVGGSVRMCNLAKMPHLLVAGTTGSGKSVCINTMLLSLIYKTSPRDLRLILIDPKQIEFAPYEDVPHLSMPIVTDMQRAAGALACAVQEMERRFSLIRDVGVRNIEAYNDAVKNDPDREHLPYIVIVIDEFNDLKMSCNNNDPENFTVRIAQKARAAGIHLIIGTQRPSVDVITGKLKGNIPSRIAFMVKQQVDSRTILDVNGAEALTGRGDMLYVATTSSDKNPVRIQGAFVSDGELERVISFVRKNNDPVRYNKAFMDQIELEMAKSAKQERKGDDFDYGDEDEGGEDPKFIEAVELAVQTQKVATSLLQRRLGVGYGRAAKIIDRMEELGLVSPAEGNKPRKLLPAAQGYLAHIGAMDAESDFEDDYS